MTPRSAGPSSSRLKASTPLSDALSSDRPDVIVRTSPESPRVNPQSRILIEEPDQPIIEFLTLASSFLCPNPSRVPQGLVDLLALGIQPRGGTRLRSVPLFADAIGHLQHSGREKS